MHHVVTYDRGVPAEDEREHDQPEERTRLGNREQVLHPLAILQTTHVRKGQQGDHEHANELGTGKRKSIIPQPYWVDEVLVLSDVRPEDARELGEADGNSRHG